MLGKRVERYRKKLRAAALATGNLYDVTDTAQTCGIDVPVAISQAIWTSLMAHFPGAGKKDLVSLDGLLQDLSRILVIERQERRQLRFLTPSMRPKWLTSQFAVRVEFTHVRGDLNAITICAENESFMSRQQTSLAMLSGALLWRLRILLFDLTLVARPAESKLVERMQGIVDVMLRTNPVGDCIESCFTGQQPSLPTYLTRAEYRWILLRSFAELLVCIGACPGQQKFIPTLVAQNRAFISPLSDLAAITEGLLRISSRLCDTPGRLGREPFIDLLVAYHGMCVSLDRGSTYLDTAVLQRVRRQLQAMRTRISRADEREFNSLAQWFRNIDPDSSSGPVVDLAYSSERSIVWQ